MTPSSRVDADSRATSGRRRIVRAALGVTLLVGCAPAAIPATGRAPARSLAPAAARQRPLLCTAPSADPATIDACRTAIAALPGAPAPRRNLAMLLAARGDHREAATAWRGVLELEPEASDAILGLAQALDRSGKKEEALAVYERFATFKPSDARAALLVAWMQLELGRLEPALASFRAASHLEPGRADAQFGAGSALASLGRHEEAIRALRESARLDPRDPAPWGEMARAALALGRTAEAVADWERALLVDASYFDARPAERREWERSIRIAGPQRAAPADPLVPARPAAPPAAPAVTADAVEDRGLAGRARLVRRGPASSGSGVVVTRTGGVLTNKHVVRGCTALRVQVDGAPSVDATVRAIDPLRDLAYLETALRPRAVATFRATPAIRRGDDVVAIGYPLAGLLADQINVTRGSINALAGLHNDQDILQMDAPVQPGSSGGPLFDLSGNVVGIVVTKLNARLIAEEMGDFPQNVNFAIKERAARLFLADHGIEVQTAPAGPPRSAADVADIGRELTTLVECYK
jgi:serine protease Do